MLDFILIYNIKINDETTNAMYNAGSSCCDVSQFYFFTIAATPVSWTNSRLQPLSYFLGQSRRWLILFGKHAGHRD